MTVYSPRAGTHVCAGTGCDVHVARHMLMCRRHWYMLPASIREAVWATWLNGAGVLSDGYRQAVDEAVAFVAEKVSAPVLRSHEMEKG